MTWRKLTRFSSRVTTKFADPWTSPRFSQDDLEWLKPAEPWIRKIVARTICGPPRRVYLAVWFHRNRASLGFAAAISQVANELFTRVELRARRLVSIEITDQTNAERDIVEIIAVDMTAVDLPPPAITHFDLAVAGGCAVADDKMIGQAVLHSTDMPVIVIEDTCVALSRAAIVHDNELPPTPFHRGAPDCIDHRTR